MEWRDQACSVAAMHDSKPAPTTYVHLPLLQLYKIYVGPVSFGAQMGFGILVSILAGVILYFTYRSSVQNQQ
jgi:hypothetical protein